MLVLFTSQTVLTQSASDEAALDSLGRVVVFVVGLETRASDLTHRKDLCVAIGVGLNVDENRVVSKLRHDGLKVHSHQWCNNGPRGVRIAVLAPISKAADGTYELTVEVGDLSMASGEHFATTVKRGIYRVSAREQTDLLSYQKTCCYKP